MPLVGIGGIANIDDVMEFLLAGTTAVADRNRQLLQPDRFHTDPRCAAWCAGGTRRRFGGRSRWYACLNARRRKSKIQNLKSKIQPMRVLSGIQPTGRFHWGNYFGAIRQYIDLQGDPQKRVLFHCQFACPDDRAQPELLRQMTFDAATDLLALGLQPDRATLFVQSDVPRNVAALLVADDRRTVGAAGTLPRLQE